MMPGMNGNALTEAARQLRPWLKVLLISGFQGATDGVGGGLSQTLLHKPFRRRDLQQAITPRFRSVRRHKLHT
jgi:CheY-like chemotaxis protein